MHQCEVCDAQLVKKPGPGRWPKRCPGCRHRKRKPLVACAHCGILFETHVATYCSTRCRGLVDAGRPGRKEAARSRARATYYPRSTVAFPTCSICGGLFCAKSKRAKICPRRECRRRFNANRTRAYFQSIGGNPYRTNYPYACMDCGVKAMSTSRSTERCVPCANSHRSKTYQAARPKKTSALVHVGPAPAPNFCPLPKRHPAMRREKPLRRVWFAGTCGHCGESFVDDQPRARWCSKACGRGAAKRRKGYFSPSPKVRAAIYERDDWICQLCREPVDPSLPTSDIWEATLDHIRCQSWDEQPDHSPSNLRLAHRWCNSVRGDETYYTEQVLTA